MTAPVPDWEEPVPATKPKPKTPPPTAMGCLIVSLLCMAILAASITLGIQTRVGCDLVADFLRRHTGLDVTVGGASVAVPLGLYLVDVQTKPSTTPLGSFKAREVRIGWNGDGLVDLSVRGARLEVMKIADGWVPAPFARVGALTDVRETAELVGERLPLSSLDVRDSAVIWSGPDGERVMSAEGLGLSIRPVSISDRRLVIFEVTARTVRRAGAVKGLNVRRLWLSSTLNPYMEVDYSGLWDGDDIAIRDWWSTPPGKATRGMVHEK